MSLAAQIIDQQVRDILAMSLATQIIDQQVRDIASRLADTFTHQFRLGQGDQDRRHSTAFLVLVARTMLDLSEDEALEGLVDGGNDYGIDALYFDPPDQGEIKVTVIQGKYRKDLGGTANFPENGIISMIGAIRVLFNPDMTVNVNRRLRQRLEDVRSFIADGAIPHVTAMAVNNRSGWTREAQGRIDNAQEQDFRDQVEWRHVDPPELLAMLQAQQPIDTPLQLVGQALVEDFDFRRVLVGRMSVAELARITREHGNRLFEKNIRRYLGLSRNRVNQAIALTLRRPEERPNFYFYNNGITITCSQFRYNRLQEKNWRVQVKGLQIINGGQTACIVRQVAEAVGPEIGSAEVLVRIYELEQNDHDLIEAVTFATNSQNPVELRDLRANDPMQTALGQSITSLPSSDGAPYSYRAKREDRAVASNELSSTVVAEAVLAVWRRRPHQARFYTRRHFDKLYNTIFTADLNGAQAVIAVLLHRQAENHRKRPPADAPDFLAYGSRFIAMLMGQYLLQDMGIPLKALDHRHFGAAQQRVEQNSACYMDRAKDEIAQVLEPLFNNDQEQTLQRLSATFRRADLVPMLLDRVNPPPREQ